MDTLQLTPKMPKKTNLSLKKNGLKRLNVSPKDCCHLNSINCDENKCIELHHKSPINVKNSFNILDDSSPPHKRQNLNDSLDFSPNNLLSQTLMVDSPEVDWRWGQRILAVGDEKVHRSIEIKPTRTFVTLNSLVDKKNKNQRFANEIRREKQCKAVELEFHRKEKIREHNELQKQCAKFQEHLSTFQKLNSKQSMEEDQLLYVNAKKGVEQENGFGQIETIVKVANDETIRNSSNTEAFYDLNCLSSENSFNDNESIRDFFNKNNSDTDDLLLAATQYLETPLVGMVQKTQPLPTTSILTKTKQSETTKTSVSVPQIANITQQQNYKKDEKRRSFYLQFLEDETPDDFFASLDDIVQQAVASKKPRTNLQRHNSMPSEAINNIDTNQTTTITTTTTINSSHVSNGNAENIGSSKIKRHASTHAFSACSDNYRGHYLHLRK